MTSAMSPATAIRVARRTAGLSQQELARRLGTSQPVIARLEREGGNPTVRTLEQTLRATGHRLTLSIEPHRSSIDESLVRQHLDLTPAARIAQLETMYEEARAIAQAGRRARGELA
jgi:transcriptional regulator with XRE-family HTH domain